MTQKFAERIFWRGNIEQGFFVFFKVVLRIFHFVFSQALIKHIKVPDVDLIESLYKPAKSKSQVLTLPTYLVAPLSQTK